MNAAKAIERLRTFASRYRSLPEVGKTGAGVTGEFEDVLNVEWRADGKPGWVWIDRGIGICGLGVYLGRRSPVVSYGSKAKITGRVETIRA